MSSERPASLTPVPSGYAEWLLDLKQRILRQANSIAFVIPAKAGIQQKNIPRVRGCCRFIGFTTTAYPLRVCGQTLGVVPLRGEYSINWIPAFTGMTCFFIRAESIKQSEAVHG